RVPVCGYNYICTQWHNATSLLGSVGVYYPRQGATRRGSRTCRAPVPIPPGAGVRRFQSRRLSLSRLARARRSLSGACWPFKARATAAGLHKHFPFLPKPLKVGLGNRPRRTHFRRVFGVQPTSRATSFVVRGFSIVMVLMMVFM